MDLRDVPTVLVPGYTPIHTLHPIRLHVQAVGRLRRAVALARAHSIPNIIVSGGAVHPEGTQFVEADEMGDWLVDHGWPRSAIIRETQARHTHTNLRNSGRVILDRGWATAAVVTDLLQSFYIASPQKSGLFARSVRDLGYWPGPVKRLSPFVTRFEPSQDVFRCGPDPLDP